MTQLHAPQAYGIPGLSHATAHGMLLHRAEQLELWVQTLAPGAATPIHRHAAEEAILITGGRGTLRARGEDRHAAVHALACSPPRHDVARGNRSERRPARVQAFAVNDTLSIPADVVHEITNDGPGPLSLVSAIASPPGAQRTRARDASAAASARFTRPKSAVTLNVYRAWDTCDRRGSCGDVDDTVFGHTPWDEAVASARRDGEL